MHDEFNNNEISSSLEQIKLLALYLIEELTAKYYWNQLSKKRDVFDFLFQIEKLEKKRISDEKWIKEQYWELEQLTL